MSVGLSERPKPGRSGARQRKPASRTGGITLPPQKRPGRLAVHEDHGRSLALVEVCQAQAVHLAIVGFEREVGQALQHLIGCAHRVGHTTILSERCVVHRRDSTHPLRPRL